MKTVVGIFDIAQRAALFTGEPVDIYAIAETLDGIPHIRVKSCDVDLLLPVSAFRILIDDALTANGLAVVPVVATERMKQAAADAWHNAKDDPALCPLGPGESSAFFYAAMLSASKAPGHD